ncbi:MAG: lipopolysaccharide heptosyltransferase I [Pseudomonadota bacterium]|jgi:heptosyltransferase-1|nr:lipopolysaccharide heptosyltransferase I [Pseudomonadota bacterium]
MHAQSRILIVKLTSLGDVIKTLPVVDDIRQRRPGVSIDWVVERPCDTLLALHPGIDRVIPLELRRYRQERRYWKGFRAALQDLGGLRARNYDLIIDLQGRMKSSLVSWLARGEVTGPAPGPASEPHYHRLYRTVIARSMFTHDDAIATNRALCAQALDYTVPMTTPRYGLQPSPSRTSGLIPSSGFAVLVHGSSRTEKCWPETNWIVIGRALAQRGIVCLLPWGDAGEAGRAGRLAAAIDGAVVPPQRVSLADWTGVLAAATVVVGVDSGLTHLAAACSVPTVAIFTATRAASFGVAGEAPCLNLGDTGATVTSGEVITAIDELLANARSRLDRSLETAVA